MILPALWLIAASAAGTVMVETAVATEVKMDGGEYRIMTEADILGIIN